MPDFMLTADDATIHPIAVFTDGFEFHAHPGKPTSRLADDAVKRRAVINSGKYLVWSITWQDLLEEPAESLKLLNPKIQPVLERKMEAIGKTGLRYPAIDQAVGNGLQQLITFLRSPFWMPGWQRLANEAGLIPLQVLANKGTKGATASDILALHDKWRSGGTVPDKSLDKSNGNFLHTTILAEGGDLLIVADQGEVLASNSDKVLAHLRLDDSAEERAWAGYLGRWRRWLSLSNLLQFSGNAISFTTSEVLLGSAPDLELSPTGSLPADWEDVIENVLPSLISLARKMAHDGVPAPNTEHFLENASYECFAEMAWPLSAPPTCLLVGDQANFADEWRRANWHVLSLNDVHGNGTRWLAGLLNNTEEYI